MRPCPARGCRRDLRCDRHHRKGINNTSTHNRRLKGDDMVEGSGGFVDYRVESEKERLRPAKLWEAYEVQQRNLEK